MGGGCGICPLTRLCTQRVDPVPDPVADPQCCAPTTTRCIFDDVQSKRSESVCSQPPWDGLELVVGRHNSCLRLWMMPCQCCMLSVLPHTWRLWASGVLHTVLVGQPMTSSIRTLLVPVVLPVCHRCPVGSWFFSSWQRELLMW